MLILDDILLAPMRGILWIVGEVYEAAQEEVVNHAESITAELRDLYMLLETGGISAEEYDNREKALLDQLDRLPRPGKES